MRKRSAALFFVALGIILFFSIELYLYSPQDIVEKIGVQNSYLFLALLSLIGGTSIFTTTSVYASVITLCAGGLQPFITAGILGVTLTLGDSLFFLLGWKSRDLEVSRLKRFAKCFGTWLKEQHDAVIALAVFFYAAFVPLPNDVLMLALGIGDIEYKKIIPYVALGNATLMFLMCSGIIAISLL